MKILYDGWIFSIQMAGGINRYFANLIDGLPDDYSPSITTSRIPSVNWPQNPNLKVLRSKKFRPRRFSGRAENFYFDRVTKSGEYDLFHPTYYESLAPKEWSSYGMPVVLTVYDMIHERFADILDKTGEIRAGKRRAIMSAQKIICISEHTKQDLMEFYPVPESKITVAYLGAELDASLAHGPEAVPVRPYFLYVGSRAPYKNFDGLLRAMGRLVTARKEVALCVVGPPLLAEELQKIESFGLSGNIEYFGYADDAQLAKLYRCSLGFVYPSLYEGFGIPPLEAMQCGTLVVAANTSSIPEVVGDGGILFDPQKNDELTDILTAIASDKVERSAIIEKGYRRAKSFSWEKTIAQTLDVYRSMAE